MPTSLLNLISTPIPILNSLGLEASVGLSSEDPWGGRHPSQPYAAYLTIYTPEGRFAARVSLGDIPPHRRRLVNLTELTKAYVSDQDHLAVVHRIPQRLLAQGRRPEDVVDDLAPEDREFPFFRSVVQYAFSGGPNGSVVYEAPPGLNVRRPGRPTSQTLTFTSMVTVSESVNAYVVLIYYSLDPQYDAAARYQYGLFAPTGELIASESRTLRPFTAELIDVKRVLPSGALQQYRDPEDGLACFHYVGWTPDGITIPLILNLAPSVGGISVEHTHPAQHYTCFPRPKEKQSLKLRAIAMWPQILSERLQHVDACRVSSNS